MARAFADLFPGEGVEVVEGAQGVAGREPRLDLPLAGRTDRWIFEELARRAGVSLEHDTLARLRARYLDHLVREIGEPVYAKRILPGVPALLDQLSRHDEVCLGLLTGNAAGGARIKLEHFGLWRYFVAGGFGDAALDRTAVFEAALEAVADASGVRFAAHDVVVVGDTPLDVEVAIVAGARSVAVATGPYAVESLWSAGADEVLADLDDLEAALRALRVPGTQPGA